nr:hypothetical protein [Tanacetum cinerariifolium]
VCEAMYSYMRVSKLGSSSLGRGFGYVRWNEKWVFSDGWNGVKFTTLAWHGGGCVELAFSFIIKVRSSNSAHDSSSFCHVACHRSLVNGLPCDQIDMIIEDLDLKPKIDAMVRDFLESPSWWKELSKETRSKILSSGDGSHGETLKPIASLVSKGKLK